MSLASGALALAQAVAEDIKAILAALTGKQPTLVSGTNIKTVNGASVLGAGDIVIEAGGAGLTLFEESRSTASPNATVPVHALTALGAETNIDFVISPKGTGAILAHMPDGTVAGGSKRGSGAVDLQMGRTSAEKVASGSRSVAMGYNNSASSTGTVSMGSGCIASNSYAIAIGSGCQATGQYSVAIGQSSKALTTSAVSIGSQCTADGSYSTAFGKGTTTRGIRGVMVEGNTGFSSQQMSRFPLMWDTSDATPQRLSTDGSSQYGLTDRLPIMPNNSAYYCRLRVLARNTSTNESKSWSGTALIKRGANAAATTLVGSSITSDFGDAALSACTVSLSADTTYGALAVTVTGLPATTIRWVAQLETVEAA